MALSFTEVKGTRVEAGVIRQRTYDVLLDTDYPTGGWPISAKDVGLLSIFGANVIGHRGAAGAAATTGYLFLWDFIANKLQSFDTGAAGSAPFAETTAGDNDLDTRTARITFTGV
jgi:hypothetical protein